MANAAMKPNPDDQAKFWRLPTVLAYVQRSRAAIYKDPTFPKPVKLGPNTSAWIAVEVKKWADDRVSASRGEASPPAAA
jgi:prophage regulatory protein